MTRRFLLHCVAPVLVLGWASGAQAGIMFSTGNHPQPGEENVLFGAKESGTSITGHTNITNTAVQFSSTTDTLVQKAQGQADIFASDGLVNNITIAEPFLTFGDLIMNPMNGSGTATVTAVTNDGTFTFTYALGNGQNFLTIVATNGEVIESVTVDAPDGFKDFKQPRISPATAIPEPTSIALLGLGVAGLGGYRILRRRAGSS